MNEILTSDVYKGAYLLLMGGTLDEVRIIKRRVEFVILGDKIWQEGLGSPDG